MGRVPMRLPRGVKKPGIEIAAGILAVASGSLAAVPFVKNFDVTDTNAKISLIISIAAAVVGGVLTIVRIAFGPPLAAGGVAWFVGAGIPLAVSRIDFPEAFSSADSRFLLAAAATGLAAFGVCASLFLGKPTSSLGGVILVLALVSVGCTAALIHVEDNHGWQAAGVLGGGLVVAIMIIIGGLKGRWGSIAALVAAGVQVPGWLDLAIDNDDRRAASIAGLVAVIGIVILATIAIVVAATTSADAGYGKGPQHALVSTVVHPMVQPHAIPVGGLQPRVGAALLPVDVAAVAPRSAAPPPSQGYAGAEVRDDSGTVATIAKVRPQWATDPYGRYQVRYFDGTVWTEHVSTDGVTALDPVS